MRASVDVAIVGAGPAGSTLAALLAGRGVSVAVVDRDRFPRDKLCGEFLSYDTIPILEHLGVELTGTPEIGHCVVVGRSRSVEFDLPHPARGVSRMLLDGLLFNAATARGAQPLQGATVTGVDANAIAIGDDSVNAKIVVGAWGRWGRFDAQLGRSFVRDHTHRSFGFKRHYVRADSRPSGTIELHSFVRGYLGVSDVEGGITNICGLVHASRLHGLKGRWDAFVETLRHDEPNLDAMYAGFQPAQDGFLSSEPVIFRARSAAEQGIFLIGDASGVIDPLTGNGMAMAIQSALLLSPLLVRLLAHPAEREQIERQYRHLHRQTFGGRIRWSRGVARILSNPGLLDLALRLPRTRNIGETFLRKTRAQRESVERAAAAWSR